MSDVIQTTEAEIIGNLGRRAADIHVEKLEPGDLLAHRADQPIQIVDLEKYLDQPRRPTGTYGAHTVDSFIAYVEQHYSPAETTVWVSVGAPSQIVAVLDDSSAEVNGWREHRAALVLEPSPAWARWAGADRRLLGQQEFAEHIEQGLLDIADPPAADMLEIAQSIEASMSASFRSGHRLQSGATALRFEETIDAKAGQTGELEIPKEITLMLAPFVGEDRREIAARFRYRIVGGALKIGYVLDRPEEILREAVEAIAEQLGEKFDRTYMGAPPA
jgi:uncharacterized protein YfdQ (DUF2303 family)